MATLRRVKSAVPQQLGRAIVGALVATATVWAFAEPETTFKLSGVCSSVAAAAFQDEMQRARANMREWWGATFEKLYLDPNEHRASAVDGAQAIALLPRYVVSFRRNF